MLLGAAAGVVGGGYVINQVRAWVQTNVGADDLWDWVARLGLTLVGIVAWLSLKGSKMLGQAMQGAALGFATVGAVGLIQKAIGMAPTSIQALRPATLAARPVVVTRRESTPSYQQVTEQRTPAY
jgi:hypothetical protein